MTSLNTTNSSERDINIKFNLAEFNRVFEQNLNSTKLNLENNSDKIPVACPQIDSTKNSQNNILFIIICIIIMIGISLLLFNNFIRL
jgi:hypothetical protein